MLIETIGEDQNDKSMGQSLALARTFFDGHFRGSKAKVFVFSSVFMGFLVFWYRFSVGF